jgi:hypothetical protein
VRGRRSGRRSLAADQRGGVIVLGLFAAALLVGFLYYVVGIGQAIHHAERLQDGADSGAYSVAVMHARGMNLIALFNMVQCSVVALISALIAVIAAATATIAWICSSRRRLIAYGWTIPYLSIILAHATFTYEMVEDNAERILLATDRAQRVLAEDLPFAADWEAEEIVTDHYGPTARAGFIYPLTDMPVEEGEVHDLCLRAYPYAYASAYIAFNDVPSSTIRNLARAYATAMITPACLAQGVAPKRVPDDSPLGSDVFQLREFVIGAPLPTLGESGVKMATWRYDEGAGRVGMLRDVLGRVKLAQAEYYFDGPEPHASMLWHMGWRARMRRFRLPDHLGSFGAECALASGEGALCLQLEVHLATLGEAFAH